MQATLPSPRTANQPWPARRAGVTLLEVMIAVGVLAVGLLGLAALLPLGQNDMSIANRADRSASTGRAAFRDVLTRGYLNPGNWLYPLAGGGLRGTPVVAAGNGTTSAYQFAVPNGVGNPTRPPFVPFVLDPLFIAVNVNNVGAIASVPYTTTASLVADPLPLPRISLRQANVLTPGQATTVATTPRFTCYSIGLAERFFRGNDDTIFTPLPDKTYRPLPQWATINSGLGGNFVTNGPNGNTNWSVYANMQSKGDFSWIAVIEPDPGSSAGTYTAAGAVYGADPLSTRIFKITVVVFYQRPVFDITTFPTTDPPPERTCTVNFPNGGNLNPGNTVEAFLEVPIQDPTKSEQYLRVKPEQWIMVKTMAPNYVAPNPSTGRLPSQQTVVYWYRIVSPTTTVEISPNGGYRRSVRLSGPDWPFQNSGGGGGTGVGVIMEGAVGVYERSWITDGSSFWSL